MAEKATHIPQLDGLRGLAVILVLLAHSTMVFVRIPLFTGWTDRYGSLGVQVFFVLSGFLITRILLETKDSERYFSSFFIRRGLRIYPLYYGTLAFVILSGVVHQHGVHWWVYGLYASNLVYGHSVQPAPLAPVWSLAVEEQYYLVWPFLVWIASQRVLKRILFLIMAGAVVLRFTGFFYPHNTLLQLDALSAGALVACSRESIRQWRLPAAFAACLMPLGVSFTGSLVLNSLSQTIQVISAAGLLIVLLDADAIPSRLFRSGVLRYIGTVSYGIYLLHSFVFSAFLRTQFVTRIVDRGSLVQAALVLALEYAVVIAVASASFFLFERPFLRLKRLFPADRAGILEGNAAGWWPRRMLANSAGSTTSIPARMAYHDVSLADQRES